MAHHWILTKASPGIEAWSREHGSSRNTAIIGGPLLHPSCLRPASLGAAQCAKLVWVKGEVTPAPVPVSVSVFEPQSTSDTGTGTFRVVPLVPAPSLAPTQSMGYLLL